MEGSKEIEEGIGTRGVGMKKKKIEERDVSLKKLTEGVLLVGNGLLEAMTAQDVGEVVEG